MRRASSQLAWPAIPWTIVTRAAKNMNFESTALAWLVQLVPGLCEAGESARRVLHISVTRASRFALLLRLH